MFRAGGKIAKSLAIAIGLGGVGGFQGITGRRRVDGEVEVTLDNGEEYPLEGPWVDLPMLEECAKKPPNPELETSSTFSETPLPVVETTALEPIEATCSSFGRFIFMSDCSSILLVRYQLRTAGIKNWL